MMQPVIAMTEALDIIIDSDATYPDIEGGHGVDHNGIPQRQWRQHLCGCWSACVPNTLMSALCPCISLAQISVRMGFSSSSYVAQVLSTGLFHGVVFLGCIVGDVGGTLLAIVFALGLWLYMYRLRSRLRTVFQIPGSMLEDLCVTLLCPICATSQMAAHVQSFDEGTCSFDAKSVLPGYHV
ncbi:hypothetical protein SPRG_14418 [Saprolegnia parasitica CBS 223.65]|uniref:Uncharacterized protein n=1 Tax=Saprolegnia parasitica (strain CBS 223.65) TaxID=695850 RepID=A0A067BPV5_SAPPC|nr:hypothetical protein SPRG_14418 [Saprolegnia parasitica CBS 223.65]KDO20283.1 hypothetical protein SPRG_14418 [Saprolegnia parasitica CBS 223.65]|eukprot:XP_012209021.1 hypothetical protein SPRG_14418 [Saprolegnia parasitica CBS 223.65]